MPYFVTIDLDAWENLTPYETRAMLRALRFTGDDGRVHASLRMLAMPNWSHASAGRDLIAAQKDGRVTRQARRGGFDYVLAPPYRAIRRDVPVTPRVPAVTQRVTHKENLPSENLEPERESSLSEGEIPEGWIAAATTERRRVDLPDVDLRVEWAKLVIYAGGERITLARWRMWAMRARLDHTNTPTPAVTTGTNPETLPNAAPLPGDEREQRQARDWVQRGFWLRDGSWGPEPDQPGCTLPAALVAWCRAERLGLHKTEDGICITPDFIN